MRHTRYIRNTCMLYTLYMLRGLHAKYSPITASLQLVCNTTSVIIFLYF